MRFKGSLRQHLPPPPCGTRKELRAARLLVLFDRCGCSASLHPPLAALGSAPPTPPPLRGRGRLSQLLLVQLIVLTSCLPAIGLQKLHIKMRRRHLESVSAALYRRCQASFVSSRSLAARESWGTAPSVSWATRHGAQPATTRTYKSRAPAAIRTDRHLLVTPPRRRRPPIWLKNPFSHFSS